MINFRKIWFNPLSFFHILLLPFSWIYGLVTFFIRISYHLGWKKTYRFSIPIIIIGNISVGGNGKTPLVIWLVNRLIKNGWKVGVISRGYRRKYSKKSLIVDKNTTSSLCGDEPLLIYRRTKVPVAVAKDRAEAVRMLLDKEQLDLIISDDGLQHYALARDVEWVVIDGKNRFGNGKLLPVGPMREGINRLLKIEKVIINGGTARVGEIFMKLEPDKFVINLFDGRKEKIDNLREIVAIAGIADPDRFFQTLREVGIYPIKQISFEDHQIYRKKMLVSLAKRHENLLMTEKDAVKCQLFACKNWWYLPVNARFSSKDENILLSSIEQSVNRWYELQK